MKTACFIPIKTYSERLKEKNFRILNGKKLYEHIISNVILTNCFDDIYVDTNSEEIKNYAKNNNIKIIDRLPELSKNTANGNDLLNYHYSLYPHYDYYFQAFATAPFLKPKSIVSCYDKLVNSSTFDSCFTATENYSFYWFNNTPVNYRPSILPRSQDLTPLYEETTGLYGITNLALKKYASRIGANPYIHIVNKFEAVDINTEDDFKIAEVIGTTVFDKNK